MPSIRGLRWCQYSTEKCFPDSHQPFVYVIILSVSPIWRICMGDKFAKYLMLEACWLWFVIFKKICGIYQAEDRVMWPDLLHCHTSALASFREWSFVSVWLRIRAQPRNPCQPRNSALALTWGLVFLFYPHFSDLPGTVPTVSAHEVIKISQRHTRTYGWQGTAAPAVTTNSHDDCFK